MSDRRTLTADFGTLSKTYDAEPEVKAWMPTLWDSNAYVEIDGETWLQETTIDLSGYALQRKTFFPFSSFEQIGGVYGATIPTALTEQPYLQDYTVISSIPLSNTDLIVGLSVHTGFEGPYGVGFNRDAILHGTSRAYTNDTSVSVAQVYANLVLNSAQNFSSLEPTAADKLYCYRVIKYYGDRPGLTSLQVPAKRVIIPGTIDTEPTLEHMMRMKRSYELANQV